MSSANEHLAPPPKPRMSPLDFRNTDLVSRLLAATPPYLYNMSLLPNTYFFSEMLRSFVQAKTDSTTNRSIPSNLHGRRTRKRPWSSTRSESLQKPTTPPKLEQLSSDWQLKNTYPEHRISGETPLELTTRSVLDNSTKVQENDNKILQSKIDNYNLLDRKTEIPLHTPPVFPSSHTSQDNAATNLILPPPPPMWYPPLYPTTPYGIDPLHFFIDLRVSGHIYDRKNQKEAAEATDVSSTSTKISDDVNRDSFHTKDLFKPSRHASAFSVPVPHINKTTSPINLSHTEEHEREHKSSKFDVKSMGFDKSLNRNGTNYIMSNIGSIFKSVEERKIQINEDNLGANSAANSENETEEQKQKRVKDLRALIGLELVVDYMNHAKPQTRTIPEESSSTDMESIDSPTVEVVALHDET